MERVKWSARRSRAIGKSPLRGWFGLVVLGLATQAAAGCLYDPDEPCGDLDVYGDNLRCVCPAGTVYTPTGCVACGAHEVAEAGGCVCEDGYERASAGEACAPLGLGQPCDPDANDCVDPFTHCEADGDTGYCTNECTSSDDCKGGYACNDSSVCQRPPAGLGKPCTSPADCAEGEATFCDTVVAKSCQVQGCTFDPDDCFIGYECCDLTMFGVPQPLCIPEGACMP
ncbi:MAG TPA: hypothetical protein VFV94_06915 [Polyangiaceae bacterium]|nr:hypothetical protein [Polyangiaceae bacterium]